MAKASPATVPQAIVGHPLQGNFCKQSLLAKGDRPRYSWSPFARKLLQAKSPCKG